MNYLQRSIAGIAIFAITSLAHGALITNLEDATNGGGFFGVVTFEDNGLNTVKITADISDPINAGLTQGDILGLWFDFADVSVLTLPLPIGINPAPFGFSSNPDSVGTSLGGNVNINGSGEDNWDLAVKVGENGSAGGFNQMVMFDLTILGLSASQFDGQRVGMRVQSIAGGSFGEGSSKLLRVPEPGILALFGLGLLGLGLSQRKRSV